MKDEERATSVWWKGWFSAVHLAGGLCARAVLMNAVMLYPKVQPGVCGSVEEGKSIRRSHRR